MLKVPKENKFDYVNQSIFKKQIEEMVFESVKNLDFAESEIENFIELANNSKICDLEGLLIIKYI